MTIFLMSIVAIARLVDMGTDNELDSRMHNRGSRLATEKLAEVEAGALDFTATEGGFDNDPEWSWTMTAEPQTAPNLYLVSVTASRSVKGRRFEVTIAQMIFDPNYMGTAAEATRPDPNADPETPGGMP